MPVSKIEDELDAWWLELSNSYRIIIRIIICILGPITPGVIYHIMNGPFFRKPDLFIISAVVLGFCVTFIWSILWTRAASDRKSLKEANKVLAELCSLDALTGLNNLHFLETAALKAVKLAGRMNEYLFSVMLDLNKLKYVNDTFGHPAGDEVLRNAAAFLRRVFRDRDYVLRVGGDEFEAIGSTDSPESFTSSLQEKIIPFPVMIGDQKIMMSFSYGCAFEKVARSDVDKTSSDDLQVYAAKLHKSVSSSADAHLYVMKKNR